MREVRKTLTSYEGNTVEFFVFGPHIAEAEKYDLHDDTDDHWWSHDDQLHLRLNFQVSHLVYFWQCAISSPLRSLWRSRSLHEALPS